MKKTIFAFALATAGLTISGVAARADFCSDYATQMSGIGDVGSRINCNVARPNWQHHMNYCLRNPPDRVRAALSKTRAALGQCQARQRGGGGYGGGGGGGGGYGGGGGGYGGGYGGGGGGGPGYCNTWAQGMVALGSEAARKGCLQYGGQGLHTNFQAHVNWCLRNPPGRTQAAAARANQLLASCNR